jgi:hypothetical protein
MDVLKIIPNGSSSYSITSISKEVVMLDGMSELLQYVQKLNSVACNPSILLVDFSISKTS